jgi:arylsulfatase
MAIRDGEWKLVAKENKPWELFNMQQDRSELNDLAEKHPEKVKELEAKWNDYAARAQVLPLHGWKNKNPEKFPEIENNTSKNSLGKNKPAKNKTRPN